MAGLSDQVIVPALFCDTEGTVFDQAALGLMALGFLKSILIQTWTFALRNWPFSEMRPVEKADL